MKTFILLAVISFTQALVSSSAYADKCELDQSDSDDTEIVADYGKDINCCRTCLCISLNRRFCSSGKLFSSYTLSE